MPSYSDAPPGLPRPGQVVTAVMCVVLGLWLAFAVGILCLARLREALRAPVGLCLLDCRVFSRTGAFGTEFDKVANGGLVSIVRIGSVCGMPAGGRGGPTRRFREIENRPSARNPIITQAPTDSFRITRCFHSVPLLLPRSPAEDVVVAWKVWAVWLREERRFFAFAICSLMDSAEDSGDVDAR